MQDQVEVEVEVEAMVRAGRTIGQIEDRIDELPVNEEAKSALWLLAWSEHEIRARRPISDPVPLDELPAG